MEAKTRGIRKDVLRNRTLLLEAADEMIRRGGMDLSLNALAHHAGVGVGTVYRHFPDRDALIHALFQRRVDQLHEIFSSCLAADDPIEGLRSAVFNVCRMQSMDRGVWEVLSAGNHDAFSKAVQARLIPLAEQLIQRANASGRLRVTLEASDMPILLWTGGALNAYLGVVSPTAWWRYVQLLLDGFLADGDPARRPIEEKALTIEEVDVAMQAWRPPSRPPE